MAAVIYCLGYKIKTFSGFNIVATNLFEDFSWKEFSFTVTLIILTLHLQNQSKNDYTSN